MDTGHTDTTVIGAVLIGGVTAIIGVTGAAGDGSPIYRLRFYQREGWNRLDCGAIFEIAEV